ncbi:MAG: arylesterase, partial [Acidobacteriaceae bacterium]|nr:arylesterase [Acidobacteriaceae bacterium]
MPACSRNSPTTEQRTQAAESSSAPVTSQASSSRRPLIVAFGDSLTAGVAGRSYPDDLQTLLDQRGYGYAVENQGVSGDTTTDGLARIDNVIAEHPVLTILEFGGNDGLRGVPVASIRENLDSMIERLKQAKIPLVLLGITLPPNYGADYVKSFTEMYPGLAKKYNLRFVPFLLINVYQHPEMMQPDGIHPNGLGNRVIAQDVFTLIQPLLQTGYGK